MTGALLGALPRPQRQHETAGRAEAEQAVVAQLPAARILVRGHQVVGLEVEPPGQPARKAQGVVGIGGPSARVIRDQRRSRHKGTPSRRQ